MHTLYNLTYSIENIEMIGIDPISVGALARDEPKEINASDHYALQLRIDFRTRSISHRSALVILPTSDKQSIINKYNGYCENSKGLWPWHINLLWPFYDLNDCQNDQEDVLLKLRLLLSNDSSFSININEIDSFAENYVIYLKCDERSTSRLRSLYEQITLLFSDCLKNKKASYNPHMTIAQYESQEKFDEMKSSFSK